MHRIVTIFILIIFIALPSSASDKKRSKILKMKNEVIAQLIHEEPDAKDELAESEGYAVFSNIGVNIIFVSGGGGKGVAVDSKTGNHTYMKMATIGVGIGLGIKDFRAVFIFHSRDAFDDFVEKGWDLSAEADAAIKSDKKGDEASVADNVRGDVSVYQMTKNGIVLGATLQGTKYWKDKSLNKD